MQKWVNPCKSGPLHEFGHFTLANQPHLPSLARCPPFSLPPPPPPPFLPHPLGRQFFEEQKIISAVPVLITLF